MKLGRRTSLTAALVGGALLLVTATVGAATIRGSAGNDTLRGTAAADKLFGLGGNDKLYGLGGNDVLVGAAGNDLLVGGPGADTLQCGAGKDVARGDAQDKAAKDCEVVTGILKPEPPAPPTPPPPPPPPPVAPVTAGAYQGQIDKGNFMYFDVLGDRTVSNWRTNEIPEECEGGGILRGGFWAVYPTPVPIASDGTFLIDWTGTVTGEPFEGPVVFKVRIAGRFTGATTAAGTVKSSSEFTYNGQKYRCASRELPWEASRTG